jgi:hypothetical protein
VTIARPKSATAGLPDSGTCRPEGLPRTGAGLARVPLPRNIGHFEPVGESGPELVDNEHRPIDRAPSQLDEVAMVGEEDDLGAVR